MKKDNVCWHDYLKGYSESLENSEKMTIANFEIKKLNDLYDPYLDFYYGNLLTKKVDKYIRKVKNPSFLIQQYGEYSFVFQCKKSARYSKKIKESDYAKYGINKLNHEKYQERDNLNNGIIDQIEPVSKEYHEKISDILSKHKLNYTPFLDKYKEYLMSDEWKYLRLKILSMYENKCVITGSTTNLDIHHLHYDNVGNESFSDLIPLRRDIHEEYHLCKSKNIINDIVTKIESFKK